MAIQYIADNNALHEVVNELGKTDGFAIDLEFDRNRYRYGFNMCLMQVYDGNECYVIDPLSSDIDIQGIYPVIEDPDIQKVVFAFGEDLRLFHSMGCFPKNLYDLDAATSLLNFQPASLTKLIKEVLDIEVNSSSQQSNWFRRPLSDDQLHYAADDVLYLLEFKKELNNIAEKQGILEWIHQENRIFNHLDYSDEDHNNLIKEKDKNNLTMFEWHLYKKLMEFFDEVARSYNKPVYHLANKKLIQEIAMDPSKADNWENTKGIFGRIKNKNFKADLIKAIETAIQEAEDQNLSKDKKASYSMSKDDYLAMRREQSRINDLKDRLIKPIQNKIAEDFGTHAKSFILPNRLAKEIVAGETELMPDYKISLLRKYSNELQLDLSEFI
jgi:ribonuclease D